MRGQTTMLVFFRSGLRATYFLHTKKVGKDVPRGVPLEPRVISVSYTHLDVYKRQEPGGGRLMLSATKRYAPKAYRFFDADIRIPPQAWPAVTSGQGGKPLPYTEK